MFALFVELTALPSAAAELESLLCALAAEAGKEAGVLAYAVNRAQEAPAVFHLYELYRDRAAWQSHVALAPVARALKRFDQLLHVPARVVFCDPLALAGPRFGVPG